MPAAVAGEWVLDDGARLSLHQRFQNVGGTLTRAGPAETLTGGVLNGSRIRFTALRTARDEIVSSFGGIDILFANAGIQAFKPLLEMEDADWHDQIDNNLNGTANAIRAFAPAMVERGGGRIIVTSSKLGAAWDA